MSSLDKKSRVRLLGRGRRAQSTFHRIFPGCSRNEAATDLLLKMYTGTGRDNVEKGRGMGKKVVKYNKKQMLVGFFFQSAPPSRHLKIMELMNRMQEHACSELLVFLKMNQNAFCDRSSVSGMNPKYPSTLHCVVIQHCNVSLCQHLCLNTIQVTHDLIRNDRTPATPNHHTPVSC